MKRRHALNLLTVSGLVPLLEAAEKSRSFVATNTYPWSTFARREGEKLELHTDRLLSDIASTDISGYEPIINKPAEFDGLKERLNMHGLEMRSLYVNSVLHEEKKAAASIAEVVAIARAAGEVGTKIIVTNPSPIRWGGPENKTDAQLGFQAESLDHLGREMQALGLTLAYHNHDAELRLGGREFHHMLTATDPDVVKLCLDSHWIFRGCGDSEVALFDAVSHYIERIVELHLRQSENGIWTEAFSMEGDIDYLRLFKTLAEAGMQPNLVLEQAVEAKSSHTLSVIDAHRKGRSNLENGLSPELSH